MKKRDIRGQVTIFIIIAMFFLIAIASFFLLKGLSEDIDDEIYEGDEIERITEFVKSCAVQELDNAMSKISYKNTDELEEFLDYNVLICLDNFSSFRDFDIEAGDLVFEVEYVKDGDFLNIDINYPLKITLLNDEVEKLEEFQIRKYLSSRIDLELDSGKVKAESLIVSGDGKLQLKIKEGTVGLKDNGDPVDHITIEMVNIEDYKTYYVHPFGKVAYEFGPDGANFTPALELRYLYDDEDVPDYMDEEDMKFSFYYDEDGVSGPYWINYDVSKIDTKKNIISAKIDHFTPGDVTDEDENSMMTAENYDGSYHHTSCHDGGMAVVMCPGVDFKFDSCSAGGVAIPYHAEDKGRIAYWNMNGYSATDIACTVNGKSYNFPTNCGGPNNGVVYGACLHGDGYFTDKYHCEEVIGNDGTDGFFSLASYDGQLYAGAFGYGQSENSMLFSLDEGRINPGIKGVDESVCVMREFNGELYANTEASGKVYKSSDGKNWRQVYDAASDMNVGCGLAVMDAYIYASAAKSDGGKAVIIRSKDGEKWTVVNRNKLYLRELAVYNDTLYGFGIRNEKAEVLIYTPEDDESEGNFTMVCENVSINETNSSINSTNISAVVCENVSVAELNDSDDLTWISQKVSARFFRGWENDGEFWIGSAAKYSASGKSGIWKLVDGEFKKVYDNEEFTHIGYVKNWKGNLFAAASKGFKEDAGPTEILLSEDGGESWETGCYIPDTGAWDLEVHDDRLFVAGLDYFNGGAVYEVLVGPGGLYTDGFNINETGSNSTDCNTTTLTVCGHAATLNVQQGEKCGMVWNSCNSDAFWCGQCWSHGVCYKGVCECDGVCIGSGD